VISELDILRTASVLLQSRGAEALSYAVAKAAAYVRESYCPERK
jgi:hypothetical protein